MRPVVMRVKNHDRRPRSREDTWQFSYSVGKGHGRPRDRDDRRVNTAAERKPWYRGRPGTRKGDKAPYTRAKDCEARLTFKQESEIHKMVDQRLKLRIGQRWDEADLILAKLHRLGVDISDDQHQWRADGHSFVYKYEQVGEKRPERAKDVEQVEELIHLRGLAKSRKDYDQADEFLQELLDLGVKCNDKTRTWGFVDFITPDSINSNFEFTERKRQVNNSNTVQGSRLGMRRTKLKKYIRSTDDVSFLTEEQVEEVQELIRERAKMKLFARFEEADRILQALHARNVEVSDESREWRADGQVFWYANFASKSAQEQHKMKMQKQQEIETELAPEQSSYVTQEAVDELRELVERNDPEYLHAAEALQEVEDKGIVPDTSAIPSSGAPKNSGPYVRAGDCTARLSEGEEQNINRLVSERLILLMKEKSAEANEKSAMLDELGVEVSDYQRLWRADGRPFLDRYVRKGTAKGRTTEEINRVHELVHLQARLNSDGEYARANDLLYELSDLGVDVDDTEMTWTFFTEKARPVVQEEYSNQQSPIAGAPWDFMKAKGIEGDEDDERIQHNYQQGDAEDYILEKEMVEQVEDMIGKRLFAKRAGKTARVEQIDSQLKELGIRVDDRRQKYYVDDSVQRMFS